MQRFYVDSMFVIFLVMGGQPLDVHQAKHLLQDIIKSI